MTQNLETLTQALLDAARRAGADSADAIAVDGTSISIDVREGKLEHAERSEGIEIGLRVLLGQRQACVSSSDTNADTLTIMAERAVAMAKEAPADPHIGLADPAQLSTVRDAAGLDMDDPAEEPNPQELQDAAFAAEAAALGFDGISQVSSSSAAYGRRQMHIAATNGFSGGYSRTDSALSCVAITGEGASMERDYYGESRLFRADLPTPEEVGRIAAERTLERADARKPATGTYDVVFDERISASLIGHLIAAINGTSITRGSSWLRDAMGEQVLPKGMDLFADPLRPRTSGSKPFDAEGLATKPRHIVRDGVLESWTLDLATARKLGLESTANAARGTSSPPSPSEGNVSLTQGTLSKAEMLSQIGTGLLVTGLIGSTINPTTGDYSRGASGFWVENGEIQYPVNECTIAGNLRDMLGRIVAANDARTYLSRVVPSLLVEGMTIAGA